MYNKIYFTKLKIVNAMLIATREFPNNNKNTNPNINAINWTYEVILVFSFKNGAIPLIPDMILKYQFKDNIPSTDAAERKSSVPNSCINSLLRILKPKQIYNKNTEIKLEIFLKLIIKFFFLKESKTKGFHVKFMAAWRIASIEMILKAKPNVPKASTLKCILTK